MKKILLALLVLTVVLVVFVACGESSPVSTTTSDVITTADNTTTHGDVTTAPDSSATASDNPIPSGIISIAEANAIGQALAENTVTDASYTVKGVVGAISDKKITVVENGNSIVCNTDGGVYENLHIGYTVTLSGHIKNDNGVVALVDFSVSDYKSTTYIVTTTIPENGTITLSKAKQIAWGETVTITAKPDNGYTLSALLVNGLSVQATDGIYAVTVTEPISVEAIFEKEDTGAASATLATFTFGANGAAKHSDGSDMSSGKAFTSGSYTLTLTDIVKGYSEATDATGKSCLKIGSGSSVGSFTFTVPSNVNSVVIYVAGYKEKTSKVTVNGGAQTAITTYSNDGLYMPIEIDTSTNKTVTVSTVSGATRVMIDAIEFKS